MRYIRDLPELNYHFSKLGPEGWKSMVEAAQKDEAPDPFQAPARALFMQAYELPELAPPRVGKRVRKDFRRALKKKQVPSWVLNLISPEEMKQIQKGGEE